MDTIVVSKLGELYQLWSDYRTPAQLETIRRVSSADEFAFSCSNPAPRWSPGDLPGDRDPKPCVFSWLWYDVEGQMHAMRIGIDGRVLRHVNP